MPRKPQEKEPKPCPLCGQLYTNYNAHMKDSHPEVLRDRAALGVQKRLEMEAAGALLPGGKKVAGMVQELAAEEGNGGGGGGPVPQETPTPPAPPQAMKAAPSAEVATFFRVVPQSFTISSQLLQICKALCEQEWGWPQMSMQDFLDTFLYMAMEQRGYIIGAWQKKDGGNGNDSQE